MSMELARETPFLLGVVVIIAAGAGIAVWRLRRRLARSEHERQRAAEELNRRLSELFSLQELSYVLSDSLELDRIVEQGVRYAVRFLDARGAPVALPSDTTGDPPPIALAGPDGPPAALPGARTPAHAPGPGARAPGAN